MSSTRRSASINSTRVGVLDDPQAFVFEQHVDVREPGHPIAQHLSTAG